MIRPKRRVAAGLVLLLLLSCLLPLLSGCGHLETGDLTGVFMNLGKADSILLYTADTTVLIDTGYEDSYDEIAATLKREERKKIDYLILTHYDRDHIGAAPEILRRYSVGEVLFPDTLATSDEYAALQRAMEETGVARHPMTADCALTLSPNCTMRVDATALSGLDDENNASLICEVNWGEFGLLLLGDALKDRMEEYLGETHGTYQVVKTPHHGDYFKKLETCLVSVGARDAVACIGPEREVEEKYEEMCRDLGLTSWRTDFGEIRLIYHAATGEYALSQA